MKCTFGFVNYYVLCLLIAGFICQDRNRIDVSTGKNALEFTTKKEFSSSKSISTTFKPTTSTTVKPSENIKIVQNKTLAKNIPEKLQKSSLVCPSKEIPRPFFSLPCTTTKDCAILGKGLLCCDKRCLKAVKPPKIEPKHSPTLFGFLERVCPAEPIPEIWEIKECVTDEECSPRICCPETLRSGDNVSYCRTAQPLWERLPAARQFVDPIRSLVSYMQCTPPPPPVLDLFPKPCQTPLDCFPNLCCQEGGKKFCRPPKRSILSLIAGIGQRLIPSDTARQFIERISGPD